MTQGGMLLVRVVPPLLLRSPPYYFYRTEARALPEWRCDGRCDGRRDGDRSVARLSMAMHGHQTKGSSPIAFSGSTKAMAGYTDDETRRIVYLLPR